MNGNRIDIMEFGLREGNGWLRAGWPYLVAAYREHMRTPQDREAGRAYLTALELLSAQIADAHSLPRQDVQGQIVELLVRTHREESQR